MADITMCNNKKCKDRLKCHRFTATPDKYRQSYFLFFNNEEPKSKEDCNNFYDNKYRGIKVRSKDN